jgi:hypothetical protein
MGDEKYRKPKNWINKNTQSIPPLPITTTNTCSTSEYRDFQIA